MKRTCLVWLFACLLLSLLFAPPGECVGVTTVVGGETIAWNLNVPSIHHVGCSEYAEGYYRCEYTAPIPRPLFPLTLSAEIYPTSGGSYGVALDLSYVPYGDTVRVEADTPPFHLENTRNDLLYLPDPVGPYALVKIYSIVFVRPHSETEGIIIDIYFHNNSAVEYGPVPFGGPGGNPYTFFNPPCDPGDPTKWPPLPRYPGGPGR